jgi:hypothetical protein
MNKGLEELKELREYWLNHLPLSVKDGLRIVKVLGKELKDYEQLKKAFDSLSKDDEKAKNELSKEIEKVKILRDIKDKQYYTLSTISDVIRDFNKGEFACAEIALQEITSLLSEVLL